VSASAPAAPFRPSNKAPKTCTCRYKGNGTGKIYTDRSRTCDESLYFVENACYGEAMNVWYGCEFLGCSWH
jgi:hypothetical protein